MLLCAKMLENETVIISGAEQFCMYNGYGGSWTFAGPCKDSTPFDEGTQILKRHIIAMDAVVSFFSRDAQFQKSTVLRDINKAYCGFVDSKNESQQPRDKIASGNWGMYKCFLEMLFNW